MTYDGLVTKGWESSCQLAASKIIFLPEDSTKDIFRPRPNKGKLMPCPPGYRAEMKGEIIESACKLFNAALISNCAECAAILFKSLLKLA